MLSAVVAALHLVSLAFGAVAVALRTIGFATPTEDGAVRRSMRWDTLSLLAALGLFGGGAWRLWGELEKPLDWYVGHPLFWVKIALVGVVLLLEVPVMWTLMPLEFRRDRASPFRIEPNRGALLYRLGQVELGVYLAVAVAAALMARGVGRPAVAATEGPACAVSALVRGTCLECHSTKTGLGALVLEPDPVAALVGVPSTIAPARLRVSPGKPDDSLLLRKLAGTQAADEGLRMPPTGPLPAATLDQVRRWIAGGAPRCEPAPRGPPG